MRFQYSEGLVKLPVGEFVTKLLFFKEDKCFL